MRALLAAQAVPFAIKPLTLKMLLAIYQQRGDVPNSNIDLYKQGCLALCEEQNKSRRDSGRRGNLNAGQRMRLAARIAAATILGNRADQRSNVPSKTFRSLRLRATVKTAPSQPSPQPTTMSAKCLIPDCSARAGTIAWVGRIKAMPNFSRRSISSSGVFLPRRC
jgi:hypothetical protein